MIALCVIATGKYDRFVPPLWESARQYFLPGHEVRLFLFADKRPGLDCEFVPTRHRPWPAPTLHRYRALLSAADLLRACDHVFYCDADMRFVSPVGEEILGGLTAVLHPGFADGPRAEFSYERRPQSRACVRVDEGEHYFAGGFQGGPDRLLPGSDRAPARGDRRRPAAGRRRPVARRVALEPLLHRPPTRRDPSTDVLLPRVVAHARKKVARVGQGPQGTAELRIELNDLA